MKREISILIAILVFISGCSKMQDKKATDDSKTSDQNTTLSKPDTNSRMENNSSALTDEKATVLVKTADDAISKYASDKSEPIKKEAEAKCLIAANYLMFDATLSPRDKYRPALKYYRKVLEINPKNQEAAKNKKQIEDIYVQMGMPIPQ